MTDNWVDIATVFTGLAVVSLRILFMTLKYKRLVLHRRRVLSDFLNGAVMFPFFVMIAAPLSTHILSEALESSKLSFSLAGAVALMLVGNELIQDD